MIPYHLETNHQLQSIKADEKLALTGYTDEPICLLQSGDSSFCSSFKKKEKPGHSQKVNTVLLGALV